MEKIIVSTSVSLITKYCPECGIVYAVPEDYDNRLRNNAQTFYCPNGHSLWYGKSEADKLRHRLDQTEAALERAREQTNGALRSLSAQKGVTTRLKNRVHNGVCTDCHRHFENLERHMKTKHGK